MAVYEHSVAVMVLSAIVYKMNYTLNIFQQTVQYLLKFLANKYKNVQDLCIFQFQDVIRATILISHNAWIQEQLTCHEVTIIHLTHKCLKQILGKSLT